MVLFAGKAFGFDIILVRVFNQFTFIIVMAAAFEAAHGFFSGDLLGKTEGNFAEVVFAFFGGALGHFGTRRFREF